MYAVADVSWGVDRDGKVFECDFCNHCIFREDGHCTQKRLQWLQQEYKEPEVDWSKVEVDTLILVSNDGNTWAYRYFAGTFFGRLYTFPFDNKSDNERQMNLIEWKFGKLIEEEEED